VRHALELSLDRDAINQVVFNGCSGPYQWVSPLNPYYMAQYPRPSATSQKRRRC